MNGIDISHHQRVIDLSVVPADFVICKASQGKTYVDDKFTTYMQQLEKLGKLAGAYHYANGSGVEAEADHFVDVVRPYLGKIILAIDWENNKDPKTGKNDNPKFVAGDYKYCEQLLVAVEKKTGITPFLYMSKSVARQFKWEVGRRFPFWCAQYKKTPPTTYVSNPWTDSKGWGAWNGCEIFQYSSKGRLIGYNDDLDLDLAYITAEQWLLYAKGNYKPVLNTRPVLKKGDINEYVLAWQYYLNLLGYNLVPDGIFGIKTEDAVKDYQKKRGLKPDGIIGKMTWDSVGK